MGYQRLGINMRALSVLLAAAALTAWQPGFAATKETYAHKMEMGNLLYFNGDVDRAIRAFQRAAELNPKAFEPHLNLVNLHVQRGGEEGVKLAIDECHEVLKRKPSNKEVHLILGNLLRTQASTMTDTAKAKEILTEAQKEVEAAMEMGAPEALCEQTIGMILLQKGDFDQSLQHIDKALKKQPTSPDAHLIRAILLFKPIGVEKINDPAMKPKLEEVLAELDLAVKQKGKNAEARNTKADILFAAGKHEESAEEYEKATQDDPRFAQAWAGLGNCHATLMGKATDEAKKKHHVDKAKDAYEKAKKLRPNDKNMIYGLAVMMEKQGAVFEAIQEFQNGLMIESDPVMKAQIMQHIQQLRGQVGFGGTALNFGGATGGGTIGNNLFMNGALSTPFSNLIKIKEPKDKTAAH